MASAYAVRSAARAGSGRQLDAAPSVFEVMARELDHAGSSLASQRLRATFGRFRLDFFAFYGGAKGIGRESLIRRKFLVRRGAPLLAFTSSASAT